MSDRESSHEDHFCIVPFVHFSSKPNGDARLCCLSTDAYVKSTGGKRMNIADHDLGAIWNSQWMKDMRLKMMGGETLPECRNCQKHEDHGKISKRTNENRKYGRLKDVLVGQAKKMGGKLKSMPIYYDLRLGNTCNLKCRICTPLSSTKWQGELSQIVGSELFSLYQEEYEASLYGMDWPKSKYFWTSFFKDVDSMEEIYISGGEPFLIKEHFELLRSLVEKKKNKDIRIRYNSNLTILPGEFIALASQFENIEIGCSFDGVAERNDWMRSPSEWSKLEANFYQLLEVLPQADISINCAVSVFNVFYLNEIYDFAEDVFARTGRKIEISLDVLNDPYYMAVQNLPASIKEKSIVRIEEYLQNKSLSKRAQKSLSQLLARLRTEKANPGAAELLAKHIKGFDEIRGQSFANVFPELKELLKC